jgi:hypothetical protein
MSVWGLSTLSAALALIATGAAGAQAVQGSGTEPYRDRIIAPDRLEPLAPDDDEVMDGVDAGPPRSVRLEFGVGHNERDGALSKEQGLTASGFWETGGYGAFSLDAALFHHDRARERAFDDRSWGGTATLWQRRLPMRGGWRVDTGLGVVNSPALPLQREQYRFLLPGVPLAGGSTQARLDGHDTHVQAAYGRAGSFTGTRAAGFEAADGQVASLGAQRAWTPEWSSAAAYLATYGRLVPDARGQAQLMPGDTRATHLTTKWRSSEAAVQANVLSSDTERGDAAGAWIDGQLRRGRYVHHYGAFRLDPELSWGAYPIQNNAEGLYYRLAYDYGRWHWHSGLDALRPLEGRSDPTRYMTGYARYQATSRRGYGAALNVRRANEDAARVQLFADMRNGHGQTRLHVDYADAADDDSWQLGVDHAFALGPGGRLSASLAFGRLAYRDPGLDGGRLRAATRTTTLGLLGGRNVTDRVSIDGSMRWTHGEGDAALRGLDFNLGVDWRIAPRWALSFAAYQSQGSRRSPFILDPLITRTPYLALPRDRSLLLTVRYDYQAGRPAAVLGGAPGAAVGGVRGSVFLDENDNGVREASELPAVNVTVLLDGRYSVRTDPDGRFEFPRVAVGAHTLTVEPDNLPLPWSFEGPDAQRAVDVQVREDVRVDLGARRPR